MTTTGAGVEKRSRKGSDGGDGDMTMEQRLKKLTAEMSVLENNGEAGGMGGGSGGVGGNLGEAPTSDSLVTLLDQALQSGDDSLLEQCIGCEDLAIIEATAQRLPTGRVGAMKRLVSKRESLAGHPAHPPAGGHPAIAHGLPDRQAGFLSRPA